MAANVGMWTVLTLLYALAGVAREHRSFVRVFVTNGAGFVPCIVATPLVARWSAALHARAAALRSRWRGRATLLAGHVVGVAAFVVVGGAAMGACESLIPWAPPLPLTEAMRRAALRYVGANVVLYGAMAAVTLAFSFAGESRRAREHALEAARAQAALQAQLAEARLHALAAQLQPHFLFNTLHVISALVRPDPRRAEQLIVRLSELLREMLDQGTRAEVPLREELAFLAQYVEIQEARFGDRLRVRVEAAPDALDVPVPRLVLQPLVENAIRHGTSRRRAAGTVVVRAERVGAGAPGGERLVLTVEDDGVGLPPGGPPREGVGLATTRARVAQLYGARGDFRIEPAPHGAGGGGTRCTVVVPVAHDGVAGGGAPVPG
jgi:signal transduction histidine kinase